LEACRSGVGAISVNGRPKRRFACVLDGQGGALEVFDLSVGDPEAVPAEDMEAEAE
jgi:anaphase-promoting complex subunit 4